MVRAKLDNALWSGLHVIFNPVVSFDLRCQSGICMYMHTYSQNVMAPQIQQSSGSRASANTQRKEFSVASL